MCVGEGKGGRYDTGLFSLVNKQAQLHGVTFHSDNRYSPVNIHT